MIGEETHTYPPIYNAASPGTLSKDMVFVSRDLELAMMMMMMMMMMMCKWSVAGRRRTHRCCNPMWLMI